MNRKLICSRTEKANKLFFRKTFQLHQLRDRDSKKIKQRNSIRHKSSATAKFFINLREIARKVENQANELGKRKENIYLTPNKNTARSTIT